MNIIKKHKNGCSCFLYNVEFLTDIDDIDEAKELLSGNFLLERNNKKAGVPRATKTCTPRKFVKQALRLFRKSIKVKKIRLETVENLLEFVVTR